MTEIQYISAKETKSELFTIAAWKIDSCSLSEKASKYYQQNLHSVALKCVGILIARGKRRINIDARASRAREANESFSLSLSPSLSLSLSLSVFLFLHVSRKLIVRRRADDLGTERRGRSSKDWRNQGAANGRETRVIRADIPNKNGIYIFQWRGWKS